MAGLYLHSDKIPLGCKCPTLFPGAQISVRWADSFAAHHYPNTEETYQSDDTQQQGSRRRNRQD